MIRALPRTDPAKHGHRSARSPSSTKLYDVPCWLGESVTGSRKEPRKVERALLAGRVGRRLGRGVGRAGEGTRPGGGRGGGGGGGGGGRKRGGVRLVARGNQPGLTRAADPNFYSAVC